jgi:hypothetical protein
VDRSPAVSELPASARQFSDKSVPVVSVVPIASVEVLHS